MPRHLPSEFKDIRQQNIPLFGAVFVFSIFTNLLMLSGPLYMLQVYDRVLGSRSEETLVSLSILLAFLFLMMGLLDYARGRVAARIGARFQDGMDGRVFSASLSAARRKGGAQTGLQDLEAVQRLLTSPAFMAIFDIPWTPLFLLAIFIFHPWLGWLALGGGRGFGGGRFAQPKHDKTRSTSGPFGHAPCRSDGGAITCRGGAHQKPRHARRGFHALARKAKGRSRAIDHRNRQDRQLHNIEQDPQAVPAIGHFGPWRLSGIAS